ncbi:hypothetical protein ACFUMI_38300 [Streptomyces sp. NPDC057273]|uniref:hypothetical protein n=1 Tax=Streptomyces sp. NPDC057273 TaxID=3346080 RepID=UPI003639AE75
MPTPAEELRAAAEKLRAAADAAVDASPLPWSAGHDEDAPIPYIAAMHPGVGAALAAWFESVAFRARHNGSEWVGADLHHALAVARQILGSAP